jgi:spore maturation protein CgeB
MIAEDTGEHRELFGEEGECVLYFGGAREAIKKANWALGHASERRRMAAAAHQRIAQGGNTYRDRLLKMLSFSKMLTEYM